MSALWAQPGGRPAATPGLPGAGAAEPVDPQARYQFGQRQRERILSVVPPLPSRLPRVPFIAVLIAIFGVGMVGLLIVNTALQNQAFTSRALDREASQLVYQEAELQSQLNRARAPEEIAAKASALGMRANPQPAFLVVPSGKVVGMKHRVTGEELTGLIVKTPAELAADKARRIARAKAKAAAAAQAKAAEAAKRQAEAAAAVVAKQQAAAKAAAAAEAARIAGGGQ